MILHYLKIAVRNLWKYQVTELIKQMPGISEAMLVPEPLYPVGSGSSASQTNCWEGKSADDKTVRYQMIWFRPEVFSSTD